MFSHETIWLAIDRLAQTMGYSTSGLAKKAGLDPTSFNKSKRMSPEGKPRWPSTESLSKILSVTNVTMHEFIAFVELKPHNDVAKDNSSIPFIKTTMVNTNDFFNDKGYPTGNAWDYIDLNDTPIGDGAHYGLEIDCDNFLPLYGKGHVLIINPQSEIRKSDRIIAKNNQGQIFVGELVNKTTRSIELISFAKDGDESVTLETSDIDWIARVLWASQ